MYKIESEQDGGSGPKGPNFRLIVMLAAAAIVLILLTFFLLASDYGRHMRGHAFNAKPATQQTVPFRTTA